jgi:UDP-N-acetylmuramoyl-tripeptide--D-alanyl-D-alanine ligase
LVSRELPLALPQLVVADTLLALGELARWWRDRIGARIVAVTGSNGKTTLKNLCASILGRIGRSAATPGNLNNEIGLPLTVLGLAPEHAFAVLEMGAGKPGDIEYLARIARPDVAVVNNVGPAHLERLLDLDGVAQTKAEIYRSLEPQGVAVINADDAYAPMFRTVAAARRRIQFGFATDADVTARILRAGDPNRFLLVTPLGEAEVALPLPGRHNVMNALAAAAVATAFELAPDLIGRGLEAAPRMTGRLTEQRSSEGWVLFDDSYNANPGSVQAGIATLVQGGGEAWLALGDMAELGAARESLHRQVGEFARHAGVARLFTVGPLAALAAKAFGAGAQSFESREALAAALATNLRAGVRVLVKGSRSSGMERVVAAVLAAKGMAAAEGNSHAA